MKKKEGHLIYLPLDKLFTMAELFGSPLQKYDAVTGEYSADRTLTPFTLQPQFSVSDKEGNLSGDHTGDLVNCVWEVSARVGNASPVRGTHYTVNDVTHALTLDFNLDPDTTGYVRFTADYVDRKRKDVLKVVWEKTLSCVSATEWKVTLGTEWQMRTDLIPWKDRGVFPINVQLRNGETDITDASAVYIWEIYEGSSWRVVDPSRDFWCRGGVNTKQLTIEQKYVQRILIRCKAWPLGMTSELQVQAFLLRRFYGSYDDDLDILEGSYIFPETSRAVAEAYVVNRSGGRIASPEQYFDIEILYNKGYGSWWHVAHGVRGEVPRSMFPVDTTMRFQFGEVTRELSALLPIAIDGSILKMDGDIVVGQYPVTERNINE